MMTKVRLMIRSVSGREWDVGSEMYVPLHGNLPPQAIVDGVSVFLLMALAPLVEGGPPVPQYVEAMSYFLTGNEKAMYEAEQASGQAARPPQGG